MVSPETPVIQAFYQMLIKQAPAVAVVDRNNKLTANLSLSDLRGLSLQNFPLLMGSVADFILGTVGGRAKLPPVSAFPDATFETCLLLMTATSKLVKAIA